MPIDLWAVAQPDVLVVKLEDVRRDPERELRRILEAAGIPIDPEDVRRAASGKTMADYMARRRARLGKTAAEGARLGDGTWRKGSSGEWRTAPPEVKRLMFEVFGEPIKTLGYEADDDWIKREL
ncbi:MAG: sulfotransferase domain-containing protein [Alphaproteobacteria bacterium]|nr:sulfotransferase domain-containing protein [Alphaproteobacteria bacterium]